MTASLLLNLQAKYFPSFQAVVSSSNDESTSLVIGNLFSVCFFGRKKHLECKNKLFVLSACSFSIIFLCWKSSISSNYPRSWRWGGLAAQLWGMTQNDSFITNSPVNARACFSLPLLWVCACVCVPAGSFILIMTGSNKLVLIDAHMDSLAFKSLSSLLALSSLAPRLCAASNRRWAGADWDQGGLLWRKDQEGPDELDATDQSVQRPESFYRLQRCQELRPLSQAQRVGHWRLGQTHQNLEPTFLRVRNQSSIATQKHTAQT